MEIGDGEQAAAAEDPPVPGPGPPACQRDVERRVLAPVREDRADAPDQGREVLPILGEHLLTQALGHRVGVPAVGRAGLGERAAGRRELAGSHRAGKDEPRPPEGPALLEHVAQALDVGAPVLGMIRPGEIVVGGEVEQEPGPAALAHVVEGARQRGRLADIGLQPLHVGMGGHTAGLLSAAGDPEDLEVLLQKLDELPADEPRRPGDHDARRGGQADPADRRLLAVAFHEGLGLLGDPLGIAAGRCLGFAGGLFLLVPGGEDHPFRAEVPAGIEHVAQTVQVESAVLLGRGARQDPVGREIDHDLRPAPHADLLEGRQQILAVRGPGRDPGEQRVAGGAASLGAGVGDHERPAAPLDRLAHVPPEVLGRAGHDHRRQVRLAPGGHGISACDGASERTSNRAPARRRFRTTRWRCARRRRSRKRSGDARCAGRSGPWPGDGRA